MQTLVSQVAAVAERFPDAHAIEENRSVVKYGELQRRIARLGAFLRAANVSPGDRVVLQLENSSDYVVALYACWAAGLVAVPINANASAREARKVLQHAEARALIAEARSAALGEADGAGMTVLRVVREDGRDGRCWIDDIEVGRDGPAACTLGDHALILYTSGTTGDPKGVLLSHGNLAANTAAIVGYLGLTSADSALVTLPFHYSYGNSVLQSHLAAGACIVLPASAAYPQAIVNALRERPVTGLPGVPSTFQILLERTNWSTDVPALRYVTQAGGAMGRQLTRRLLDNLRPETRLFVMYGQTEASARLTYLPPERLADKLGSVGRPISGIEIRVVDDGGRPLPPGEKGEVVARGGSVMLGYWRNEAATKAALVDGWLHTGDVGYLDEDGFLFLEGRRSDMIKTGAHRVNPEEIEEVVAELDGVREVAACGVPDDVLGQVVHLFVVGDAQVVDDQAIMRHCRRELAMHKLPRRVHRRASLPRTASGKIKRQQLVAELQRSTDESDERASR